ncbi:PD-(D/E)XK nuclease family protein [Oryzihumus leptocrescens]|uniref:PD-(D/E)XK nuclease superfamily protein n=1 Tax=Oryzihumus leptocrescens TaxID=297536 RepID=A0A542ZL07_9MICO|nr:PD-(D/E)XK nuclease family protein [Oryzihumus leptocrescens]TQL60978.1 PD-(D/E)XK nuclease superfamily protein [Oryzihumus leptocrescens]
MDILDDETLARHRDMGATCHRIIATLAARTREPDIRTILDAVDQALPHLHPHEARAHRQNLAGAVKTYFTRLLPPPQWRFHGAELHLGRGRIDLLWRAPHGALLIDELKTGHAGLFASSANLTQARRYLHDGRGRYGRYLSGLRLLSLSHPAQSVFLPDPYAEPTPLAATAHLI